MTGVGLLFFFVVAFSGFGFVFLGLGFGCFSFWCFFGSTWFLLGCQIAVCLNEGFCAASGRLLEKTHERD